MGKIEVNGIRVYAKHGCLKEESIIGQEYIVDVEIEADFSAAVLSDQLVDTVDYCEVTEIVQEEMKLRSKLIETVAKRIVEKLKTLNHVIGGSVTITKPNPPIAGDVRTVRVVETL